MFDPKKPTVQMLGRWQPWHDGHQELFKRCIAKTGQVIIQVRDVQGVSGGIDQDDNPFDWDDVCKNIENGLLKDGYKRGIEYEIMLVPNIVNITYGRGVGYKFEEEIFDESVSAISATNIATDTFTGNGSTTSYTLVNGNPASKSLTMVYIQGVYQAKASYSLTSGAIVFTTAPAEDDAIEVLSISAINKEPLLYATPDESFNPSKIIFTSSICPFLSLSLSA